MRLQRQGGWGGGWVSGVGGRSSTDGSVTEGCLVRGIGCFVWEPGPGAARAHLPAMLSAGPLMSRFFTLNMKGT